MKPDNTKHEEDVVDNETECLSAIDDADGGGLVADGSELKLHSDPIGGADGINSVNAIRRIRHNVKEKERKEKIKTDMQEIRSLLPSSFISDKKQTHHDLLQLTIQYIRSLEIQNKQLTASGGSNYEVEQLRKENEDLKLETSRYRTIIGLAGIPAGTDLSQLVISWRCRTIEEMGNQFMFPTSVQPVGANLLPSTSVESDHRTQSTLAEEMSQQFNGQMPFRTNDGTASQFTMYTDLLNSSDPSCMVLSSGDQPNSFAPCVVQPGTSLVSHNGQFMFLSQPSMPLQAAVNHCQSDSQTVESQNTEQQQQQLFQASGNETTIDRKQLDDDCKRNGDVEDVGLSQPSGNSVTVAVSKSELGNCGDNLVHMLNQETGESLGSLKQDSPKKEDEKKPLEETVPVCNQEFFTDLSSVSQMTANGSMIFSHCTTVSTENYNQQNVPPPTPAGSVSAGTEPIAPSAGDGQLQGSFLMANGQLLLVNQNQNMTQQLAPSINGGMIGQEYSSGFCATSMAGPGMPMQGSGSPANTVFLNKSNQYGPQPVTFFPGQTPFSSALLQPPLASNQTVTVNTPQGPMIMHTLPSKPNEHPQALILPDGQIVPVVTQPNLLYPPQQCIPVTGSLLVPSVTPSRMGSNLVSSTGQHQLAKLVDGKSQTFALPPNPPVQLNTGIQSFSSIMPQVLPSGIDTSRMCPSTSLQAVPAQGHLPLPPIQPCSTGSKYNSSRSKKKPSASKSAPSAGANVPQTFTAFVTNEGNLIFTIPNGEIASSTPAAGQAKSTQRPLMPKPVAKTETVVQPVISVSQSTTGCFNVSVSQVTPANCSSLTTSSLMSPLTISMPAQPPVLPFSCVTTPRTGMPPATDILAKATESIFTISPNSHMTLSDLYPTDNHDDQLHIDISAVAEDIHPPAGVVKETKKPPSKKKKNAKPKSVMPHQTDSGQTFLEVNDEHNLTLPCFSPAGKTEDEKESDINDFADLIRMEPMTPAPVKTGRIPDDIEILYEQEGANESKSSSLKNFENRVDSDINTLKETTQEMATTPVNVMPKFVSSDVRSLSVGGIITSSEHADISGLSVVCPQDGLKSVQSGVTLEPKHVSPISSSTEASVLQNASDCRPSKAAEEELDSGAEKLVEKDELKKDVVQESVQTEAIYTKKTSPRKKKSHKGKAAEVQAEKKKANFQEKTEHEGQCVMVDNKTIESDKKQKNLDGTTSLSCNKVEAAGPKSLSEGLERKDSTVELLSPVVLSDSNKVKSDKKLHGSQKDKKGGKSGKKEKSKAGDIKEDENVRHNGKHCQNSADLMENETVEQESGTRRGFALSNFLPAASKSTDLSKTEDARANHGTKRLWPESDRESKKLVTDSSQKMEEATQTIRKELKNKNHDDIIPDGRAKKRLKKSLEHVEEDSPEELMFTMNEIFEVVDKVENMAAATQTEPTRRSHGRKHKSSSDRDGSSSKRPKKNGEKHEHSSMPNTERAELVEFCDSDSTKTCSRPTGRALSSQNEDSKGSKQSNPMDVFSFEMEDDKTQPANGFQCFRTPMKKSGKTDLLDNSQQSSTVSKTETETVKTKESNSSWKSMVESSSSSATVLSEAKTTAKFSLFSSTDSNSSGSATTAKSAKASKSQPSASLLSFELPLSREQSSPPPIASGDRFTGLSVSSVTACDTPQNKIVTAVAENIINNPIRTNTVCTSESLKMSEEVSMLAKDLPCNRNLEDPKKDVSLDDSKSLHKDSSANKVSTGKARHTNIVSLAGTLTPKSAVTKLSAHAQRNKPEKDVAKESTTALQEADQKQKTRKECDGQTRGEANVPSLSAETRHQQNSKPVEEMVETHHASKAEKPRTQKDKEQSSKNELNSKTSSFNEDTSKSNANHYIHSQPVLSQCAYNDSYPTNRTTPSNLSGLGGSQSAELCNSLPSSRSGCSQKSGSMQTSGTNVAQSKMGSGYSSSGGSADMERKSWQEDSRRRSDSNYFATSVSSGNPSCAVQNKNSDLYSCSSLYPTDKTGMMHHQQESANCAGTFGGLPRNSFYPLSSAFGGLDQLSPCSGGENVTLGSMSSCSVDKHSSTGKSGNQSVDPSALRRDMTKASQHDGYYSSQCGGQFLEPNASPTLSSLSREKNSCLGTSMTSQTNSRQPVSNTSASTGRSRSQNRSPSVAEQPSPYAALSGYHSASSVPGSLSTTMLHHPPSMSDYRYSNSGQHSLGFDMFQSPGTQFNPNLAGLTFDPPPLNFLRDCSSVSGQSNGVKKSSAKASETGFDSSNTKSSNVSRTPHQPPSNQSQSCKTGSSRSSAKSSSSKKTSKPSTYNMDTSMFDARSGTPYLPDSLQYFQSNLFGNTARTLPSAKSLQHRDTSLSFNPSLFSPRTVQNGLALNFQPNFGMEHVHGSHMTSAQVISPPSANAMPTHMHSFGFGNFFPDIGGTAQRDPLSNMSPLKFGGSMDSGTLHHHHHQGASSMYNSRGQLSSHMMGFNPFLGPQHPGFDTRSIGTHFGSHGHAASFGMGALNFPMPNI